MDIDQIQDLDSGAKFYVADLHIHSFAGSDDVRDEAMTPEAIVDAAVAEGVRIISITDHSSETNVGAALAHAKNQHNDEVFVIPGAEISCPEGHLLIYFSPSCVVSPRCSVKGVVHPSFFGEADWEVTDQHPKENPDGHS